jgi:hypothetical protein
MSQLDRDGVRKLVISMRRLAGPLMAISTITCGDSEPESEANVTARKDSVAEGAPVPVTSRPEASIPANLAAVLDTAYPHWSLAKLSADLAPRVSSAKQWLKGDFNGDALQDFAIQLVRDTSALSAPDSMQMVIAFLAGANGSFRRIILRTWPRSDIIYLALVPRGDKVPDLEADLNGDSSYVLSNDAIGIVYAEKASETCRWVGSARPPRFICRASGD